MTSWTDTTSPAIRRAHQSGRATPARFAFGVRPISIEVRPRRGSHAPLVRSGLVSVCDGRRRKHRKGHQFRAALADRSAILAQGAAHRWARGGYLTAHMLM